MLDAILNFENANRRKSVKVKVKNELIKRHKTTHSVQIQRRWLRYSEQMCLESATENRQTVCFSDWGCDIAKYTRRILELHDIDY